MILRRKATLRQALAAACLGFTFVAAQAQAAGPMTVFASPSCGCCATWVRHVEKAGFKVAVEHLAMADLYARKQAAGFSPEHASCHTALVDGYAIEGHVSAADIRRLLKERPEAIGLSVPGMLADAPGMGTGSEPYEVLLVKADGSTESFARYPK